jgi:drug/metabolite transporter (DMT)-like permease
MLQDRTYRWLAIILVLIGAASFGVLSSFVRLAYDAGFNTVQVTSAQIAIGTFILWVVVLVNPRLWVNPFRGPWIKLSLIGMFGLGSSAVFFNASLKELSVSLSIVLLFQFTWITIAIESIMGRKWPSSFQWIAIGLVMGGTVLTVGLTGEDLQTISGKGIIFGLLAGFTYSVFLAFTGKITTTLNSVVKSAIMMTAALSIAVPMMFLMFPAQRAFGGDITELLMWGVLLGMMGHVIPTIFLNYGIPRIGGSLSAVLSSMELPAAVIGAFFILHEAISSVQWTGIFLILAGILISELKWGRNKLPVKDGGM